MELNKYIEHTLLKQDAKKEDFIKLFGEAIENKFFGVCVNPNYVSLAKDYLKNSDVKIVTVVGFPLGNRILHGYVSAICHPPAGGEQIGCGFYGSDDNSHHVAMDSQSHFRLWVFW